MPDTIKAAQTDALAKQSRPDPDITLLRQAADAGRLRIRCKDRVEGADSDAGMVWPIEIELPCINGLSCWFTIGNLYTPDASARGYTDGALSHELARDFAAHIIGSLSPVSKDPDALAKLAEISADAEDAVEQGKPIAWMYEINVTNAPAAELWIGVFSDREPERGLSIRNIRPLYEAAAPSRPTGDLAKLAEIPAAGSEERDKWLEEAYQRTVRSDKAVDWTLSDEAILTLMSEARKQGQRDCLGASFEPGSSPSGDADTSSSSQATAIPSRGPADLVSYLHRQWGWSKETFGPALRTKGIVQHITKELREIEADPHDLAEWVDVIILAMDGFWRHGGKPEDLLPAMQAKQDRNFARTWPDWRTVGEDQAIEHDRSRDPASEASS